MGVSLGVAVNWLCPVKISNNLDCYGSSDKQISLTSHHRSDDHSSERPAWPLWCAKYSSVLITAVIWYTYNTKWTAEQSRYISDQYLVLHCRHISVSTVKYLSEQSHKMSCVVSHVINRTIPEKVTSFWAEQAPRPARVSAHILRKQEPVRWEKILAFMSGSLLRCNTPMMQNTPHSSDSDDLICTLN